MFRLGGLAKIRILLLTIMMLSFNALAESNWRVVKECGDLLIARARQAVLEKENYVTDAGHSYYDPNDIVQIWPYLPGTFFTGVAAQIFIPQSDSRITSVNQIGLRGGGVCSSMCAMNVLWAVRRHFQHHLIQYKNETQYFSETLSRIDEYARVHYGHDIATGLMLTSTMDILRALFRDVGLQDLVRIKHYDAYNLFGTYSPLNQQAEIRNMIWIGSFYEAGAPEKKAHHAVVILKVDPVRQVMMVSDPNDPTKVWNLVYYMAQTETGHYTIELKNGLPLSSMSKNVRLNGLLAIRTLDER